MKSITNFGLPIALFLAMVHAGTTASFSGQIRAQEVIVSAKVTRQLGEMIEAYQHQDPHRFVSVSKDILNRSGKEDLKSINLELRKRGLPSVESLVAQVRILAAKSGVPLPPPTWNEFRGILPQVVQQIAKLTNEYDRHPLSAAEVTSPDNFSVYEDHIWQLHVFRNKFNILSKVAIDTDALKNKFGRQIKKNIEAMEDSEAKAFRMDLQEAAKRLKMLVQAIDEREAEIRVLRIDDANDLIVSGKSFASQFDAAFALAYDQLFFKDFIALAEKENREFKNADLNDGSLFKIVDELIETAKTRNPNLFEKATLFYVGSHWWLRGRYGQGPLANGLLKSEAARKDEDAMFPLFMPTQMPNVEQLLGNQNPKPVIRRHEFIWSLGNEGIESRAAAGRKTPVVATLDRFY